MNIRYRKVLTEVFIISTLLTICLYIGFSPIVATPFYNKLIFYPDYPVRFDEGTYRISELCGCKREDARIKCANGQELDAWFFRNPHASKVVLVSHGNASNISSRAGLANELLKLNYSVLLYDYRGYGLSEGEPSIQNICTDGLAAYDFLCSQKHYKPSEIILYGESLGCAVTSDIASKRGCNAMILQAGFSSLRAISAEMFPLLKIYPEFMYPRPSLDTLAILKHKSFPILFIHGTQDPVIPVSHSQLMFASVAEPKQLAILPNSEHSVSQQDVSLFEKSLRAFLLKFCGDKPSVDHVLKAH